MKNLSFFVSVFALCASTSYAAINCGTLPSCASLGYTDTVSQCPNQNKVLKCPFDTAYGKCIYDAAVGAVQYFPFNNYGNGWLLCDGSTFTQAQYPDLYEKIKQTFCTTDHGGTCGTGVGRLPNYKGYFLRVYGTPAYGKTGNSNLITPQKEGLPNITGTFGTSTDNRNAPTGAFSWEYQNSKGADGNDNNTNTVTFNASASSTIYGAQSGVTPPNFAVYAYIYAGRKAQ